MKNTLLKGLSVLMLIGLLLAACGGGPQATEAPASETTEEAASATEAPAVSGGVLTVGIPVEPETLDPGDARPRRCRLCV